jgi:hypothetical protein
VYVADEWAGLRVISVADPAHPTEVGYCGSQGFDYGVAVAGDYAYVAAHGLGLRIVSIADPVRPVEVGLWTAGPDGTFGVAADGQYAYVADNGAGLRITSVADPANPTEVGYYNPPGQTYGVALGEDYIYVAGSVALSVHQFYGGGVEEKPNA